MITQIKKSQLIAVLVVATTMLSGCLDFARFSQSRQPIDYSLASIVQAAAEGKEISLGFNQMLEEVQTFIQKIHHKMAASKDWLKNLQPDASWFDLSNYRLESDFSHSNKFVPFVEKIIVPQDACFAVWGDLHGSFRMLSKSLQLLQKDGYFDDNFIITKPNFYMFFIGDYVDHQPYGIETLFIATKLHNQNPKKVFLLRGNHEDAAFNTVFRKELAQKFKDINLATRNTLYALYDYLPLAIFAGIKQDNDMINYIQFCHGGFEHGYSARNFLQSSAKFEKITHFNRNKMLAQMPDSTTKKTLMDRQELLTKALASGDTGLEKRIVDAAKHEQIVTHGHHWLLVELFTLLHKKEISHSLPFLFQDIEVTQSSSSAKMRVGFSWSSFGDDENNQRLNKDDIDVLWAWSILNYGPQATQDFLDLNSAPNHRIISVVRGHQHQGRMLQLLKQGKGLVNLWNGKVITTVASQEYTGYACFNKINFASDPKNWKIEHFYASPGKDFEQNRQPFFGT